MAFRDARLQKIGLADCPCPLDGFPEGPAAVPLSDDDDNDSSVSDDVDVLGRDVEVMLGELKSMAATTGCDPGGLEQATRLRGLLMAMDLRWKERVEGDGQPARPSSKTIDGMLESFGIRTQYLLQTATRGTPDDELNEWPSCPHYGEKIRRPIALDYLNEAPSIGGESHVEEERGRTVFKHQIAMIETEGPDGCMERAYNIVSKARMSATDIYGERNK